MKGEGKASLLLSSPKKLSDHQCASHSLLLENKFHPTSLKKWVSVFSPPKGQQKVHSREARALGLPVPRPRLCLSHSRGEVPWQHCQLQAAAAGAGQLASQQELGKSSLA